MSLFNSVTRQPVRRHLSLLGHGNDTSFALPLKDRSGPLYCDRLLRLLPGKRATFHGHFGRREVLIKTFFAKVRHRAACSRELTGLQALASAGCAVPEILYVGPSSDNAVSVIVMEWLANASTLEQKLESCPDDSTKQQWLQTAATQLARMHLAGCQQNDLHLGNFLVQQSTLYAIDGDGVTQQQGPLSFPDSTLNFALFCAQFAPAWDTLLEDSARHYSRQRFGASLQMAVPMKDLWQRVQALRVGRLLATLKKTTRKTSWLSAFNRGPLQGLYHRQWQSNELEKCLNAPSQCVADAEQILKRGNSAGVVRLHWAQGDVVLKHYKLKSWWHHIKRAVQMPRAVRAFCYAHVLLQFGIRTPTPIAQIVQHIGPFNGEAWYLSAAVDGQPLLSAFEQYEPASSEGRDYANKLLQIFDTFAALRLSHGDWKQSNFCWSQQQLVVMDLDATRYHRSPWRFRRAQRRDLNRFLANFNEHSAWHRYFADAFAQRGWH